jgi:hypothetical protein
MERWRGVLCSGGGSVGLIVCQLYFKNLYRREQPLVLWYALEYELDILRLELICSIRD